MRVCAVVGEPCGEPQGTVAVSEEAGDGSEDFEDIDNAGKWKFLLVETVGIDGNVTENVGSAALA